jgi:hypothetical protein
MSAKVFRSTASESDEENGRGLEETVKSSFPGKSLPEKQAVKKKIMSPMPMLCWSVTGVSHQKFRNTENICYEDKYTIIIHEHKIRAPSRALY